MAIFHFTGDVVSRKAGQSAVAKSAYISRSRLTDERDGEARDFRAAGGLLFSGIYLPKDAPEWAQDRQQLWNEAERAEKRKDATIARTYEIALPHELTDEQRHYLVQDFVKENFTRKGYAADVALHAPDKEGDNRNYHAHILVTDRRLEKDGFAQDKKERQGTKKERVAELEHLRERAAHHTNRQLERYGHEARVDHRSLEAQGIDREPTQHLGPTATELEREGKGSERGKENREIKEQNQDRADRAELREIEKELADERKRQHEENRAKLHEKAEAQKAEREQRKEQERETIRLYRGIGKNVWEAREGEALFFSTNRDRAAAFGVLHYVDVTRAEFEKLERPHSKRILEAEAIAVNDYRVSDPKILARLQRLEQPELAKEQERENLIERAKAELAKEAEREQQKKREESRAAKLGATLYDRADMVSMQRDAIKDLRERNKERPAATPQAKRDDDRQEQQRREMGGDDNKRRQDREEEKQKPRHKSVAERVAESRARSIAEAERRRSLSPEQRREEDRQRAEQQRQRDREQGGRERERER